MRQLEQGCTHVRCTGHLHSIILSSIIMNRTPHHIETRKTPSASGIIMCCGFPGFFDRHCSVSDIRKLPHQLSLRTWLSVMVASILLARDLFGPTTLAKPATNFLQSLAIFALQIQTKLTQCQHLQTLRTQV